MNRLVPLIFLLACPLLAKNKAEIITVHVLSTDAWTRTVNIHHAGTQGTSSTNCDTNGTISDPAGTGTANVNATTDCTTTSTPGSPGYTTSRQLQQETVHVALPDGRIVTVWCQKAWRACVNLPQGTYRAQVDGASTLWIFVPQLDKSEKRIKYKLR